MKRAFLRPTDPDYVLIDPTTLARLPADGMEVQLTTFWRRRIEDGSVVEGKPEAPRPRRETKERAE